MHFLERKIGEMLTGIVWGVNPNGLVVRGIEIPVDGMVTLERLPADRYRYDRDTHTLQGYKDENQFRLGDELVVRIERVDLARRHLEFRLEKVTHHDRSAGSGAGSGAGAGSAKRSRDSNPSRQGRFRPKSAKSSTKPSPKSSHRKKKRR